MRPIPPTGLQPGYLQSLKRAVDPIADAINRGLIADSPDIRAVRLPDGRVTLKLNVAPGVAGIPTPVEPPPSPTLCFDANCENAPATMRLQIAITGELPTKPECNDEVPYPIDLSADSGTITMASPICAAEVLNQSVSVTCSNPACNEEQMWGASADVSCQPDNRWALHVEVDGFSACAEDAEDFRFGGGIGSGAPVLDINIGADPRGTHSFSFDDPNMATIHYEITIIIT